MGNYRYNNNTGTFTADTAGLYYFEVHFLFETVRHGTFYIRKNDIVYCTQWGQGGSTADGEEIHAACSVLLQLQVHLKVIFSFEISRFLCFLLIHRYLVSFRLATESMPTLTRTPLHHWNPRSIMNFSDF